MVADIRDNIGTGDIKVAELLCTRVGLSIVGVNEKLRRESKNS